MRRPDDRRFLGCQVEYRLRAFCTLDGDATKCGSVWAEKEMEAIQEVQQVQGSE